jgi:hypothetical protein
MSYAPIRRLVRQFLLESAPDGASPEELDLTDTRTEAPKPPPPFFTPIPKELNPDEGARRKTNLMIWFGGSKIRQRDGAPLRMFHGTNAAFTSFKVAPGGLFGPGIYFTDDPEVANRYTVDVGGYGRRADDLMSDWQATPNVIPAYLRVLRPYVIPIEAYPNSNLSNSVKAEGYDGIVVRSPSRPFSIVVVFDPRQVKSALGNVGDFDWRQEDITLEEDDSL